ncbi:uncharacterized protein LOC132747036 [Ruditapes philippinarum]|uniref:uncharacterized protein LOC132747036 n=1 Tax=Ruditapes philippinarum TaxID=129788 RepID=UPI00295AE59D|nr:uncharacterized protein LOC132747036 [Ruditapes philippinarum]
MSSEKPSKPKVLSTSVDSVNLAWNTVKKCDYYQVSYKILNEEPSKWRTYPRECEHNEVRLGDLIPDTKYVFRVKAICGDDESPNSDQSEVVTTSKSPAENIPYDKVIEDSKTPSIRLLRCNDVKQSRNEKAKTKKVEIGIRLKGTGKQQIHEKTILLVGETGTGKSTMIDGITNYVLGVRWEDSFRFKVVQLENDEKIKAGNQAESQTDWITCYTIYQHDGGRIPYTLNIIDTPGFGDTRGMKRDNFLVEQIHELFSLNGEKGIVGLDAVCFLIKAPDARLTSTQRYIFESIMALFGKDIKNNMCTLLTFADGRSAPALSSIKSSGLPFGEYSFTLNNSGLFAENNDSDKTGIKYLFWKMGIDAFGLFFKHLVTLQTTSLELTKKVLDERKRLELTIDCLLLMIDYGLEELNKQRREIKMLEDNEKTIESHKDFEYETTKTIKNYKYLPPGQNVTNCRVCKFTCHGICGIRNDAKKRGCWAMDSNGYCEQCPQKCYWNSHQNAPYIFYLERKPVKMTFLDVKEALEMALGISLSLQQVIAELDQNLQKLEEGIEHLLSIVNTCNNELQRIALRPNSLTIEEHIELMIKSEEMEKRTGFKERIDELKICKEKAQFAKKLDNFKAEKENVERKKTSASNSLKRMLSGISITVTTKVGGTF